MVGSMCRRWVKVDAIKVYGVNESLFIAPALQRSLGSGIYRVIEVSCTAQVLATYPAADTAATAPPPSH